MSSITLYKLATQRSLLGCKVTVTDENSISIVIEKVSNIQIQISHYSPYIVITGDYSPDQHGTIKCRRITEKLDGQVKAECDYSDVMFITKYHKLCIEESLDNQPMYNRMMNN